MNPPCETCRRRPQPWVTTGQAARILRVNRRTITSWINEGKLASLKTLGGHNRIRLEELNRVVRLIEEGSVTA